MKSADLIARHRFLLTSLVFSTGCAVINLLAGLLAFGVFAVIAWARHEELGARLILTALTLLLVAPAAMGWIVTGNNGHGTVYGPNYTRQSH